MNNIIKADNSRKSLGDNSSEFTSLGDAAAKIITPSLPPSFAAAVVEYRQERADELRRFYLQALSQAQAHHDPWDWMMAGSFYKRWMDAKISTESE